MFVRRRERLAFLRGGKGGALAESWFGCSWRVGLSDIPRDREGEQFLVFIISGAIETEVFCGSSILHLSRALCRVSPLLHA